jgi:hypothetical protein
MSVWKKWPETFWRQILADSGLMKSQMVLVMKHASATPKNSNSLPTKKENLNNLQVAPLLI